MNNILAVNLCNSSVGYKIFSFLGNIFNFIKLIIPLLIIIHGTIDLTKGLIDPNNKKNLTLFIKRLILGVAIYFISTLVLFIMSLVNNDVDNSCLNIFLNPNDETIVSIDINNIENENACNKLGNPYIWEDSECRIDMSNESIGG